MCIKLCWDVTSGFFKASYDCGMTIGKTCVCCVDAFAWVFEKVKKVSETVYGTILGFWLYTRSGCEKTFGSVADGWTASWSAIFQRIPQVPALGRLILYIIGRIITILGTFLMFLKESWGWLFILILFAMFWTVVGRPWKYLLEEQPADTSATAEVLVTGLEDFANILLRIINRLGVLWNMIQPFIWSILYFLARVIKRVSYIIGSAVSTGQWLAEVDQKGSGVLTVTPPPVSRLLSTTGRNLQPIMASEPFNPILHDIEQFGAGVFYGFDIVLDILFDLYLIWSETVFLLWAGFVQLAKTVSAFALCVAGTDIGNMFVRVGCILLETLVRPLFVEVWDGIRSIIGFGPPIPEDLFACTITELGDVPCRCSALEGGVFRQIPACPKSTTDCVKKGSYWYYYVNGNLMNQGQDQDFVCNNPATRKLVAAQRNDERLFPIPATEKEDTGDCHYVCVHHETHKRWMIQFCQGKQYFAGLCDEKGQMTTSYHEMSTDRAKAHASSYTKLILAPGPGGGSVIYFPSSGNEPTIAPVPAPGYSFTRQIDDARRITYEKLKPSGLFTSSVDCSVMLQTSGNLSYASIHADNICTLDRITNFVLTRNRKRRDPNKVHYTNQAPRGTRMTYQRALESHQKRPHLPTLETNLRESHATLMRELFPASYNQTYQGREPTRFFRDGAKLVQSAQEAHTRLTDGFREERLQHLRERRELIVSDPRNQPVEAGLFSETCPVLICPDRTCPKNNDYENCVFPDQLTLGVLFRSPAYLAHLLEKSLQPELWWLELSSCWLTLLDNPEINPASTVNSFVYYSNNFILPVGTILCFPMLPPVPKLPLFVWNYRVWLRETCGPEITTNSSAPLVRCTCPQYYAGSYVGGWSAFLDRWIPGISFSYFATTFNGYRGWQVLWTRVSPAVLNSFWQTLVSLLPVFMQTPEVINVFNPVWASGGMDETANNICLGIMAASMAWFIGGFLIPLYIFAFPGRKLVWEIGKTPIEPILYLGLRFLQYLHELELTRARVESYRARKKEDIAPIEVVPHLKQDID